MLHNFRDRQAVVNIPIKHLSDQIDAFLRKRQEWYPERVVQDLIDVVKWVFFVDDGVEKDTKGPNILLLASVRLALQYFRGSVV
jgi:hypothetical protein